MAGAVISCLDLISRIVDLPRALAALTVNQQINDIQIEYCSTLINDVHKRLEIYDSWLSRLAHINVPNADLAKQAHSQCSSLVTNLKSTLERIKDPKQSARTTIFPTTLKELLAEVSKQFEQLKAEIQILNTSINELYLIQSQDDADASSHMDSFVFTNMVQPNPLHVFLDFQSEETPECQLKKAIFQGPDKTVSAVASGMGGIGKTCALRGAGLLEEAKSRFPGGILYMSLGAEAGKHELIRNLADFVKQSGGARASVKIGREDNIAKAVTLTAKWYEDHSTLFLIDDVWCTKGIDSTVTEVLAGLARNSRSRVAFTTRDRTVRSHVKIQFKKRGDTDAKKILLQSSGCTNVSESPSEQSAFRYLLNISDGLPIALGVIGKRARYLIEERSVDELEVWELVRGDFEQPDDLLLEDASRDAKDETVLNVLLQSLKMVDAHQSGENLMDHFACFSVLRKRQEVPVDVLGRIWGIGPKNTKRQIEMLERFSIVEILHWFQGKKRMCIVLHDLFLDISRILADDKDGFRVDVCTRLLYSYVPNKKSPPQTENFSSQQSESSTSNNRKSGGFRSRVKQRWKGEKQQKASSSDEHAASSSKATWELERTVFQEAWATMSDDGFARRNVFRLLDIAGMHDEGIALNLDPRWVTRQVNLFGRKQFNDDAAIVLKHIEQNELREGCASCAKAIRMIKAAVTENEPYVTNASSTDALWSQLYGRLSNLGNYEFIQSFLNSIDEFAPRPWVRSQGALPVPTALAGKVMNIPDVRFLRSTSDCVEIVNYSDKEYCLHLHRYFPEEDNVHLVKTWSIPREPYTNIHTATLSADASTLAIGCEKDILIFTNVNSRDETCARNVTRLTQHKGRVQSASISADGKSLITGGGGGEVAMWRFTDSVWEAIQLEGHTDDVRSVGMCPDGKKAVSGGKDMTVRLWTKVEGGVWISEMLTGHCGRIWCIDLSDDGRNVVAASSDTIVVWERRETKWVMSELEGHGQHIVHVALDKGGIRIVSASADGKARLWERREGVWSRTETLEGHSGSVTCAAIGASQNEIFTCSSDGTVRMWNVGRDRWETGELRGHRDKVGGVAVSGDRRRVVSRSNDGEVLLWEKDRSSWKVNSLKKDSKIVTGVAISSGGRLIVSGLWDGKAFVFEEESGRWTSQELIGHTDGVTDVAISLDDKVFATASADETVSIWRKNDRSWEVSERLEGHTDGVISVALSGDGSRAVSGSSNQTVRVWDLCAGGRTAVQVLSGHKEKATAVAITPDGSTIASGDQFGTVKVWVQTAAGDWAKTAIGKFGNGIVKKLTFSAEGAFLRAEKMPKKQVPKGSLWFAQRDGAWREDPTRGGAYAAMREAFGDGHLNRRDWPVLVKEFCAQMPKRPRCARMWGLGDGWYLVDLLKAPFIQFLQLVE